GTHSVMLLRPLSGRGGALFDAARARFLADFALQLADPLHELEPLLAARLLRRQHGEAVPPARLIADDRQALQAFADAARSFEDCLGPLYRQALQGLSDPACALDAGERQLLVAKLLQKRSWRELAALLAVPGRAAVLVRLRQAAGGLRQMLQQGD
ncbi:MAG TPA: tRNA cytosine(34) acetyltransferase TmcA, partial [Gammaproteobacteria bacterium]|nr:tRNA cytosine(34) acetyltransferase TmcA [Gammaproteobacteria bacterium]